jgi:hypothetical protein
MTDEIPENYTNLDHALRRFEASEAPFYDGMRYLKQAVADLRPLLSNRVQYMTARRALKIIAAQPCESGSVQPTYSDCEAAIAASAGVFFAGNSNGRCWPCYARHVLNGGEP